MKLLTFGAFASILIFSTTGAFAKDVAVSYHDLNLSLAADQVDLNRRVEAAARDVCQVGARPGSLFSAPASIACYRQASAVARAEIAAATRADAAARLALLNK